MGPKRRATKPIHVRSIHAYSRAGVQRVASREEMADLCTIDPLASWKHWERHILCCTRNTMVLFT
jgi:hypothetical protein